MQKQANCRKNAAKCKIIGIRSRINGRRKRTASIKKKGNKSEQMERTNSCFYKLSPARTCVYI